MGRHRLNYMGTRGRSRPPVFAIVIAVTICTTLLLFVAFAIAILHSVLMAAIATGRGPMPWTVIAILIGAIVVCAWCGVAIVRDMYRGLRSPDLYMDDRGTEVDNDANECVASAGEEVHSGD